MERGEKIKKFAFLVKNCFEERFGSLEQCDLKEVFKELERMVIDHRKPIECPKMHGGKHLPEIVGTNLEHALRVYEWGDIRPVSKDGKTVSGFERVKVSEAAKGVD